MQHQLATDDSGHRTLVVFGSFGVRTVDESLPHFDELVENIDYISEDELLTRVEPGIAINRKFEGITERIRYDHGHILFDGDRVDNSLTRHMLERLNNGDEWRNLALFMEKLAQNPSADSRQHLYFFVEQHGLTIDENGDIILYKGVSEDGNSISAGFGLVDGVEHNGHLPNKVGSVLEFPRSKVDPDRTSPCSTGLHAGTFGYAKSFGPRLLTVTVSPADVVSVPSDCESQKVRVCRYRVAELAPLEPYTGTSHYFDSPTAFDVDEYDEYDEYDADDPIHGDVYYFGNGSFGVWIEPIQDFQYLGEPGDDGELWSHKDDLDKAQYPVRSGVVLIDDYGFLTLGRIDGERIRLSHPTREGAEDVPVEFLDDKDIYTVV